MQRRFISVLASLTMLVLAVFISAPAEASTGTINIVSLGDSYTAGNGALVYEDNICWRSGNAYIHQYRQRLQDAGFAISAQNHACMSAVTSSISGQLETAQKSLEVADIIFVTIGGNDAHFVELVTQCMYLDPAGQHGTCRNMIDEAHRQLSEVARLIMNNLHEIREAAPKASIILIGYPELVSDDCAASLYENDIRELQARADIYYQAAVDHAKNSGLTNVQFLSMLEKFEGHGVCGNGLKYIRGTADTTRVQEWWHPNVEGHAAIADELLNLGIHKQFIENSIPPPAPSYQLPQPTSSTNDYDYLPFECGVVVPYVSTYDTYNYNGTILRHGLSLDMPMKSGTPVVSPVGGIAYVHYDQYGYGNFIDVVGDNGFTYRMAHLSSVSVSHGQRVARGKLVGAVGSTGASTGPHLHFEQIGSTGQVAIDLGGPTLQWGPPQDASGFRTTTHSLLSGNCGATTSAAIRDSFADLVTFEFGTIRYARGDGYDYSNWQVALPNITKPTVAVACDFDGDGWDEYLSYERQPTHPSWIMMADPQGNGKFQWSKVANVHTHNTRLACGDWNNDGYDDILMHNTQSEVIAGLSNGSKVYYWQIPYRGIGTPTLWDLCDVNGDGREDIVSYERWANRFVVGYTTANNERHWKILLSGIYDVRGFTCGNFTNFAHDEIVVWQPEQSGRYVVGRFNSNFSLYAWKPMTPTGFTPPYNGELVSGDIDGDGYDEFVTNEYRSSTRNHSVMVGDFTSRTTFSWHPFIEGVSPRSLTVGNFVG